MSSSRLLTLLCLLILLSCTVQAMGKEPAFGVWMRLEGVKDKNPAEISNILERYGVNTVFFLIPLPPTDEELTRIKELRSGLNPSIGFHLWIAVYRNSRYLEEYPHDALVSTITIPEVGWIKPTSTYHREKLLEWVQEAISQLDPDGVFLDYFYVPYPGPFDNQTMQSFSSFKGRNLSVSNVTTSPDLLGRFFEWRNDQILETLRAIRREIKDLNLSVFIHMLDMPERLARGQDVEAFASHTDFLVSHTYHFLLRRPASWVGGGIKALKTEGARDVWAGIQGYEIPPEEVYDGVKSALKSGAEGVVLFRYATMTQDHWEQARLAFEERFNPTYWIIAGAVPLIGAAVWFLHRRATRIKKPEKKKDMRKHGKRRR